MRVIASAVVLVSLIGTLAFGFPTSTKGFQGTSTPGPTVQAFQTQVAEQVATIEALSTTVTRLETRLKDLSGSGRERATGVPQGETYEIGDEVEAGDFTIVVTGTELIPSYQTYDFIEARGIFLVVYFTVTNGSNAPVSFPYDALTVSNENGRSYGYSSDATIGITQYGFGISLYEQLQPDLPYDTAVIFDIPVTATGLTLAAGERSAWTVDLEL